MVVVAMARLSAGEKPPPRIASAADGAAETLFDIASILNQSETADLSLIYGRLAIELKPNFPLAALLVGDILETEHRSAEALAIDRAIAAHSPDELQALLRPAANRQALEGAARAVPRATALTAAAT